ETSYEIVVSDSSTDRSPDVARQMGVVLVKHDKEGYGRAYMEGVARSRGRVLVLGDADDTYDFREIPALLRHIDTHDLIMGRRAHIHAGAMPWLHRYVGNPLLSGMMSMLFGRKVRDCQSGLRVMRREVFDALRLRASGMEFASEMVIKAVRAGMRIKEVPIHYYPRKSVSKLRSFPDGWKNIRFMLLYSPLFLFIAPGALLFVIGVITMTRLYFGDIHIGDVTLYHHPMFIASLSVLTGFQLVVFALFTKAFAANHLGEKSDLVRTLAKTLTLERTILIGGIVSLLGLVAGLTILIRWIDTGFGALEQTKLAIVMMTLFFLGIQTVSSGFMLSILAVKSA
ncbi:MAG: glycosyltransferase family 2 protein, partial [Nanoarchaeota archaeon]